VASAPHFVTNNIFSGVSNGIWAHQGGVHIERNVFKSLNNAIQWDPMDSVSQLIDNQYIANGSDMYCTAGANPNMTGHGNVRGGGSIICYGCLNCPFQ